VLRECRQQFRGTAVGITADATTAKLFHEEGWTALFLGEASPASAIQAVSGWHELPMHLTKLIK
jgi:hypothetical protein